MKGIVLSGGLGTRLRPLTNVVSKQLLPVYDKPMIYYPMATLLSARITEIALISTPDALPQFQVLFGSGNRLGVNMKYIPQAKPAGIAQSLILAEDFIRGDYVTLILGDNIFHGQEETLADCLTIRNQMGAKLFGYRVANPSQYGVACFNERGVLTQIKEKPSASATPSNVAITGLYQYDETAAERAKMLQPSHRGELEITDLNNVYIQKGAADLYTLSGAWLDMGSPEGLLQASNYVQTIQTRQGVQVACLEEIAFKNKMIGFDKLESAYEYHRTTEYGNHIKGILDGRS
jgi:glucose-1-phosphate thymidylyltransferase